MYLGRKVDDIHVEHDVATKRTENHSNSKPFGPCRNTQNPWYSHKPQNTMKYQSFVMWLAYLGVSKVSLDESWDHFWHAQETPPQASHIKKKHEFPVFEQK